ncbi:hypothetical protein RHSIM_Rhsim02G0128700 [Rhododendron simsii]|uniref:Uncharacterized protein n=1 Tax=Rhododendron simsii TaxID=118357 RepID=A0A834HAZ5_RHOSS|nr:hypothetical protein RHSIM_Rhsim02G0128700 [Rhododendron simsii]
MTLSFSNIGEKQTFKIIFKSSFMEENSTKVVENMVFGSISWDYNDQKGRVQFLAKLFSQPNSLFEGLENYGAAVCRDILFYLALFIALRSQIVPGRERYKCNKRRRLKILQTGGRKKLYKAIPSP